MKCGYCNGTGEHVNDANRMTTCEFCGGTGEVEVVGDSVTDVCDKCGGTGFFCEMRMGDNCTLGSPCTHQKPLTNEEWFCGLSTEEKARFITRYGIRRQVLHSFETVGESIQKSTDRHLGTTDIYEPIEEWLKQPHNSPK